MREHVHLVVARVLLIERLERGSWILRAGDGRECDSSRDDKRTTH
jgi:hypothetical protein